LFFQHNNEPIIQEPHHQYNESLATEEEENHDSIKESSDKFIYRFDDPLVKESAYVQVSNNKIIVQFPVKPDHTRTFTPMHHVQLYLNKQLLFHSNWLPILTTQDQVKFKHMFQQIWHEYTVLTNVGYWSSSSFVSSMHSERVTTFSKENYYLSCFENNTVTSIELDTKITDLPAHQSSPIHVQFYFGAHLVFCSETQLYHLNIDTLHFVLSFILLKLMN